MEETTIQDEEPLIRIDSMSIDQLAGAVVLFLGAVGSLLLVIWQSRCLCRCRIGCSETCYIFDCSREPPPITDEEKQKEAEPEPDPEPDPDPELIPKKKADDNIIEP
jgi:hypothetical protein